MFEQAFKRIDTILRQDDGCSTELDYIEQPAIVAGRDVRDELFAIGNGVADTITAIEAEARHLGFV